MRKSLLGRFLLAFSVILLANLALVVVLTLGQSRIALEAEYRYRLSEAADKAAAAYLQQRRLIATGEWARATNNAESNLSSIYVAVWEQPPDPQGTEWSDAKATSVIGDRLQQALGGERVYWMDGDTAYAAVPVGERGNSQAVLLVGLPKPAPTPLWHYGQTALYTLLAVSVPTLLLSWAFFGRITRPLTQMVQMADAVAEGDFSQRVGHSSEDEVGTLGKALNQMAQQLDSLDKARRTFLAGVSHDLRTPLTTIKANTQAMLDQIITAEEQPEFLASTIEEIDRLRSMVDSLIDASSPEDKMALSTVESDLGALLQETAKQLQLHARQAGVELATQISPGITVLADQSNLRRALLNVLDNAIRFSPRDAVVMVSLHADKGSAIVTVHDAGCGMVPELSGRVFEPFVKAPGSSGSGLGLHVSKKIVEAHGGDIFIDSVEGRGTTVTIFLPLSGR